MKKNTTKIFIAAVFLTISGTAFAQEGRVGINTSTPAATLDVVASPSIPTRIDGLIAPRLKGSELISKNNLYTADQDGAIVYVTEAVSGVTYDKTTNVTSIGYYYFDKTVGTAGRWMKIANPTTTTYQEPWVVQGGTTPATTNLEAISQNASVAIGKSTAYNSTNQTMLDVAGAVRGGTGQSGVVGSNSAAFGNGAKAAGTESFAIGNNTTAAGAQSFAGGGSGSTATGQYAFAFGSNAQAKANHAVAMGVGTVAPARSSVTLGRFNVNTFTSTDITQNSPGDPIFQVGAGADDARRYNIITTFLGTNGTTGVGGGWMAIGGDLNTMPVKVQDETLRVYGGTLANKAYVTDINSVTGAATDKVVVADATTGQLKTISATEASVAYKEPWNIQNSSTPSASNNDAIYQTGNVAIGRSIGYTNGAKTVRLDVQGEIRTGAGHGGAIGINSVAMGLYNVASGETSFAAGNSNQSIGSGSASFGDTNINRGDNAFVMGSGNTVVVGSTNSFTGGGANTMSGNYAFTMGQKNVASGETSFAAGKSNQSIGSGSASFGDTNINRGDNAFVMGSGNTVNAGSTNSFTGGGSNIMSGNYAFTMGKKNTVGGEGSGAFGEGNTSSGDRSIAVGFFNTASGSNTFSGGTTSEASGDSSVAFGISSKATNKAATAFGEESEAKGYSSVALGHKSIANGKYSVAVGVGVEASSIMQSALGSFNHVLKHSEDSGANPTNYLFMVGDGYNKDNRSNIIVAQAGNGWSTGNNANNFVAIGSGTTTPSRVDSEKLRVYGGVNATSYAVNATTLNVPDYVFQNYYTGNSTLKGDYKFVSNLYDVENYLKENHHLPGVTSASEIKKAGFYNLEDMQMQSLEKVEELYLHTIEQQKQIDELKDIVKQQQKQIDQLLKK